MKKYTLGAFFIVILMVFGGVKVNQANAENLCFQTKPHKKVNLDPRGKPGGVSVEVKASPTHDQPNRMEVTGVPSPLQKDANGNWTSVWLHSSGTYYIPDDNGDDIALGGNPDTRLLNHFYYGTETNNSSGGGHGLSGYSGVVYIPDTSYHFSDSTGSYYYGTTSSGENGYFYLDKGVGNSISSNPGSDASNADAAAADAADAADADTGDNGFAGDEVGGSTPAQVPPCASGTDTPHIPIALPPSKNIEIPNPLPLRQTTGSYSFSPNLHLYPPVPVSDPITVGHVNPGDGSHGNTSQGVGITEYNTVLAPINSGIWGGSDLLAVPSKSWPSDTIFKDLAFWNNPLSYTFQGFTSSALDSNSASHFNWYPLNIFTVADPTSRISALPAVPINVSWASVKDAVKYRFALSQTNPLGTVPQPGYTIYNTPPPPSINSIQTAQTYLFFGRPSASFSWSATPLKADGTEVLGPTIPAGDTGYTANPFWIKTATAIDYSSNPNCGYIPGQRYFTNDKGLTECNPSGFNSPAQSTQQVWNNATHQFQPVSVTIPDKYFDGYYSGYKYIEWKRIPGAARYELKYFMGPPDLAAGSSIIPVNTPANNLAASFENFTDNTTFTATYTAWVNGSEQPKTGTFVSHVIGGPNCINCGLNDNGLLSNDLNPLVPVIHPGNNGGLPTTTMEPKPNFQYAFGTIPISSFPSTGGGIYWGVRGIDKDGNVIRVSLVQNGSGGVALPKTPYQSAYINWPRVTGATSYIVDIAENAADLSKLPYLAAAEVPLTKATAIKVGLTATPQQIGTAPLLQTQSIKIDSTTTADGTTSQANTTLVVNNNVFLLRTIVPDLAYDAADVTVTHFKKSIKEARVYIGKINSSIGNWDYDGGMADQIVFDDQAKIDTKNFTIFPDSYYPFVFSDDLGMNSTVKTKADKASLASNKIELTTYTPITVTDKSTGDAVITVTQTHGPRTPGSPSTYWVTTIITFSTKKSTLSSVLGNYAFTITKDINTSYCSAPSTCVIHPLTYKTFGPMPIVVNQNSVNTLDGRAYAQFNKLLPNQTYYWRVRALKDPQVSNPNSTAAITFLDSWSTVSSFTTPAGISTAPVNIGSLTEFQDMVTRITPTTTVAQPAAVKNISWLPVGGAKSYVVKIYLTSDRTKPPFMTKTIIGTTSFEFKGSQPGVKYYYDVSAINAFDTSLPSTVSSFTTEKAVPITSAKIIVAPVVTPTMTPAKIVVPVATPTLTPVKK